MASKRRNMFHKNKTQETTEEGRGCEMRNSNLLKWAQNNKQNDKGGRNWIHPPEALQKGHIAYLVKFLGNTEVDQPKGIEVVKEGIRKLKFNQQLRKSEGTKTPKVELTISIDGVAIQEPKTKRIIHQYPLHRISYCADDKGEKKFFSFIAKDCPDSERHMCFVFVSDKLAEEITLTIGQAFDLAYKFGLKLIGGGVSGWDGSRNPITVADQLLRRFLETSGKDLEVQKRVILLQQRVKNLEHENTALRQRLSDVINGQANDLEGYMRRNKIMDMLVVTPPPQSEQSPDELVSPVDSAFSPTNGLSTNGTETNGLLLNLNSSSLSSSSSSSSGTSSVSPAPLPTIPPRAFEKNNIFGDLESVPAVGTKLEGLLLEEMDEEDFNPRAYESAGNTLPTVPPPLALLPTAQQQQPAPLLAPPPPPKVPRARPLNNNGLALGASSLTNHNNSQLVAGLAPPRQQPSHLDPFGMADFSSITPSQVELENAIGVLDKRILEMKDGFSRGLSFGNEDFSIESLDPLRK